MGQQPPEQPPYVEEGGAVLLQDVTPLIRRNAVSELWSFGTWDLSFLGCLVEFLTVRGSGHGFDPRRSPSSGTFGIALQTGVTQDVGGHLEGLEEDHHLLEADPEAGLLAHHQIHVGSQHEQTLRCVQP